MFRIKICGLTSVEDAQVVARAGADAIGLNFYPPSPRCVAREVAQAIVKTLPAAVVKVGLFVNPEAAVACRVFDDLGLDLLQLHGDERPEFLSELGDRPVMKVFRPGSAGLEPIAEYLAECGRRGCLPRLVLLDAFQPGAYGGTGQLADWPAALQYRNEGLRPPLVLAGGLTPENVARAIRATGVAAVDTASGVESAPGRKDPAAVAAFVRAAMDALAEVR